MNRAQRTFTVVAQVFMPILNSSCSECLRNSIGNIEGSEWNGKHGSFWCTSLFSKVKSGDGLAENATSAGAAKFASLKAPWSRYLPQQ
jgi:hypothetical protein